MSSDPQAHIPIINEQLQALVLEWVGGGTSGGSGAIIRATWNWTTAPVTAPFAQNGKAGVDTDAIADATTLFLHAIDGDSIDEGVILSALASGDIVYVQQRNLSTAFWRYTVTGPAVLNGTTWGIPVTLDGAGSGSEPGNGVALLVAFEVGYSGGVGSAGGTLMDLSDVTGTPGPNMSPVGDDSGMFPLTHIPTTEDIDAILASVAHVEWRPLVLRSGFSNFDADPSFATPKYRLTLNNVVHLEGMVACSPPLSDANVGTVLTTLDSDSLPDKTLLFGCPAAGNNARFDVLPTGDIVFQGMLMGGGEIDWFSLTPIQFSVGAAAV